MNLVVNQKLRTDPYIVTYVYIHSYNDTASYRVGKKSQPNMA